MIPPRLEKTLTDVAQKTLRSVRQEGKPVLAALDEHWSSVRNALAEKSAKDAFVLHKAEGDLGKRLSDIIDQHQLPEHFKSGPVIQRDINSSVRALIHRNVPVVRMMDFLKGLAKDGQHTRVIFSKYATPNGLADDLAGMASTKGFKKLSDTVYQSRNSYLVRLSDTESVLLLHDKLPESLAKVVKGVRNLLEGLSEWVAYVRNKNISDVKSLLEKLAEKTPDAVKKVTP